MKIGILGSGAVGKALALGFIKYEYDVMAGSRQPDKLESWKDDIGHSLRTGTFAETARAIEPLAMLWCIPGFRENHWTHAFRLLKV